jgi:hypothetical protein
MLWYAKNIFLFNQKIIIYYLDEATQEKENLALSTNEIIEDTQSTQEELNNGISRNIDEQSSVKTTIPKSLSAEELSADNCFKNAYYVFRALCKLSDRDIKDKANTDPKYKINNFEFFNHLFFFI